MPTPLRLRVPSSRSYTPFGKRPFGVHIDPTQDGAEAAFGVIDRVRDETLHRVGFSDLLKPRVNQ